MKLEGLLGGLNNPQPGIRLDIVRVLGMLDETRALDALRQRYAAESDPAVKSAIAWAGKRLYEAQQAGYSTVNEICRHFGVDKEIENSADASEEELLKKLQDNLDADLRQMQDRANRRRMGTALAAGLGGALVGGATVGINAMAGALLPGAGAASSNLEPRPVIGTQRSPATAPSAAPIDIWVRRLRDDPQPARREQAALELGQLNNPAALPHLAAAFVNDESPQVRQAAQRYGKILYWSAVYWDMEQDGSLQEEMGKRALARGKNLSTPSAPAASAPPAPGLSDPGAAAASVPPAAPPSSAEINEILRRAKAARDARQKRK